MESEQFNNSSLVKAKELWISELYKWADDNNIPELEYYEDIYEDDNGELVDYGFWVGLPRDSDILLNLEELNLSWHNCIEIPDQIRHLTKLKKLEFIKSPCGLMPTFYDTSEGPNKITQIPDWVAELVNLEVLDLSGNAIEIVPKSIAQLQNLKQLFLQDNEIVFVDGALGQLNNLEVLWIQGNSLYGYWLTQLNKLDVLWMEDNVLKILRDSIMPLKSLTELYLDGQLSEPLKARPGDWQKFFSEITTQIPLKDDELWMQDIWDWSNDNNIGFFQIPGTPESLLHLSELNLNRKNLKSLPDSFSKLNNIKKLSISQNQFDTIPSQIRRLGKLTSLSLNECHLTCLPEWIGELIKIEELSLYSNQLSSIPDGLSKLKNLITLNLGNNEIISFSGSIKCLAKLESLFLGGNKLTCVSDVIGEFKKLTYLDLSHNNISSLPSAIKGLSNLEYISLGYNSLTTLPRELGNLEKLKILNLGNNQINCLPDSLKNLSNLSSLQLQNNRLVSLPEWLGELKELAYLNVTGNQITRLPDCIKSLPKLMNLSLDGHNSPSLLDQLCELDGLDSLALNINDRYELICLLNKYTNSHRLTVKNLTLRLPPIDYVLPWSDDHKRHIKELLPSSTICFSYNVA